MRDPSRFARTFACAGVFVGLLGLAGNVMGAAPPPKKKNTPTPPLPNVLLLVDTSGSMEKMIDGSDPENNSDPNCGAVPSDCSAVATTGGAATCANRWGTLLQSMTGQFSQGYRCWKQARNGPTTDPFPNEYAINGQKPYDYGYYLPYHRPVSQDSSGNNCTYGPYKLSDKGGGAPTRGVGLGGYGTNFQALNEPDEFATDALALFAIGDLTSLSNKTTTANVTCTTFDQVSNGALDAGRDLVRFGVMTFDSDPDKGVGVTTPAAFTNLATPFTGMWSYFPGWDGAASGPFPPPWTMGQSRGWPAFCSKPADFEVGGRNPAAPMWEGRMVQFPDPASPILDVEANADNIKRVLLSSRPYGATPIQGMLWDARQYFYADPNGPFQADPWSNTRDDASGTGAIGCRDQYIILITDGTPNLDLEPTCQGAGPPSGQCPFEVTNPGGGTPTDRSDTIVADMAAGHGGTLPIVRTFVIAFAVDNGAGTFAQCSQFVNPGTLTMFPAAVTDCADPTKNKPGSQLEACCTLQKIALAGNTDPANTGAYFVETPGDLGKAFAAILGQIVAATSSRTSPTYSPVLNSIGNAFSVTSSFLTAFDPVNPSPVAGAGTSDIWPWAGNIQRIRTVCKNVPPLQPVDQAIASASGDDFRKNLDSSTGPTRNYLTVQDQGSPVDSTATLRQYVTADNDGLGTRQGFETGPDFTTIMSKLTTGTTAPYMNLVSDCPKFNSSDNGSGAVATTFFGSLRADDCAKAVMSFTMGLTFGASFITSAAPYTAYDFNGHFSRASGNVNSFSAFGPILHSNPIIMPPPSAGTRDDSYRAFATINTNRPHVLYVATTDGLLHAFDVTSDPNSPSSTNVASSTVINAAGSAHNNEIWTFIPPAVLPALASNYPGGQQNLLDGSPSVRDVIFQRDSTQGQSIDGSKWHTALVAGFGQGGRGYYALDVTDPLISAGHPWTAQTASLPPTPSDFPAPTVAGNGKGPHFLWQLGKISTKAANEVELFGKHSATPSIATLAFDDGSGGGVKEIGVAILPGGQDDGPFGECPRYTAIGAHGPADAIPADDKWIPRAQVRQWAKGGCYPGPNSAVSGRSVTIVRLDTGEIVRTFGRFISGQPTQSDIPNVINTKGRATHVAFDSPMTGTPVVYPAQVGAVAVKFFVGDADGTVWKFDVSSTNPATWTAQMFFDTFGIPPAKLPPVGAGNRGGPPSTATDMADISQPISILPIMSLDPIGNLVLHIATGDQDTFSSTVFKPGKDDDKDDLLASYSFIYSVSDMISTLDPSKLRASVNWYLGFADGERVTGPMAVFDSVAYFATFAPTAGSACALGEGRIWGENFTTLATACAVGNDNKGCGGAPAMVPFGGGPLTAFVVPGGGGVGQDPELVGHVVSGVSVRATPPCANTSQIDDTYAGGKYGGLGNITPASYSLFASVATKATAKNGASQLGATFQTLLAKPKLTTTVDSWAAIVE